MWKHPLDIQIIKYSDYYITANVHIQPNSVRFILTSIYGKPRTEKRLSFWANFKNQHNLETEPWVIIGGFNQILSPHDKLGGAHYSLHKLAP